jgi:hypothetical protein
MKFPRIIATAVALIVACSLTSLAQQDDLGRQLSKVAGENAMNYLSPLLSGLGADLNSGIYHSADLHDVLGFDVGVKLSAVLTTDADKTFDFVLPDEIVYSGLTLRAGIDYDKVVAGSPTALGENTGREVKLKSTSPYYGLLGGQTIFTTPQGFNLKGVPLLVPQAAIGLPLGFEVIGRFIPTITVPPSSFGDPVGKVNFIGFGLRHDIDQYIPLCPVDIAIHFMTQKLTLSDNNDNKILSGSGTAYGVEVSKSFALLTLYGGFQLEKSKWDIDAYNYSDPSTNTTIQLPGFSLEGKNKSRFHAGVRFLLLIVNIHADYSFATQPVITAGVGISFR